MISKELSTALGFAVREAKKRRHEYVCVEHVLYAILNHESGSATIEKCGGSPDHIKEELEKYFEEKLTRLENKDEYVLQQTIGFQRMIQRAISHARSAEKSEVSLGDILASIFQEKDSHAAFYLESQGITRLDLLRHISHGQEKIKDAATGTQKDSAPQRHPESSPKQAEKTKRQPQKDPLAMFATDLLEKARKGRIDPLVGREEETERIMQVLCRRRKNNPILVGDPGVGKTAIADGLALKILKKQVPELLDSCQLFSLDLGALIAGTKYRGEFEQRMKDVINALGEKENAVLVIDEIHTVIGAGSATSGSMDASNILKPALSSGEIKCIGTTTYEEYKNHFTKDRAFSRRFEKIEVAEPSVEETGMILKGLRPFYEEHHGLAYTDKTLEAAAYLSDKYINDRFLPDKAIDVIDEAGAHIKLKRGKKRKSVTPKDIEQIVSKIARVPIANVTVSDRNRLESLSERLSQVVFGQDESIDMLTTAIKRSRAGLSAPQRPVGSFLFTGPTGVGKTEVARQLATHMDIDFLRFDMSEYMEKHTISRLIGAPPGYVGFDQGGLLTDGIRKHPHCVLLLDEIEKAHMDIYNILLQVMDYATLTDNNGKTADFRNVIIIMTSNVGARELAANTIGFSSPDKEADSQKGNKAVERTFSPEFRNRLDGILQFHHLSEQVMEKIVDKNMKELKQMLKTRDISMGYSARVRTFLAHEGYSPKFGARPLERIIQKQIKDKLSDEILFGKLAKGGKLSIGLKADKLQFQIKSL